LKLDYIDNKTQREQKMANNVTMKLKDIDPSLISIEPTELGGEKLLFIRYGPEKKTINIQLAKTKLMQYGIQPGEKLSNGQTNQYYQGEDARLNIRIPFDPKCAVTGKNDVTNEDEINADITALKKLDARFKELFTQCGIDEDDKEKYVPIYRKPAKSKNAKAQQKEKFCSIKAKFDTTVDQANQTKKIRTEFYEIDDNNTATLKNSSGYITMKEVEKLVTYNCELCPIVQMLKVWTQSNGSWGITLKLKKIRVKRIQNVSRNDAEFLDSDEDVKVAAKPASKVVSDSDSESDSESDTKEEIKTPVKVASKAAPAMPTAPVKSSKIAVVESESDSESDSEDEVKAAPIATKASSTAKKIAVVESDSDESDDEDKKSKAKAKKPVSKSKKSSA
jgi:hypothetical protein